MKLADLKANPNNPRIIKDEKFARLKKSLKEFPQMMALRPIVIDESGMILGGNMRLAALKANGLKEIPDDWVKRADELTEEQKKEFIIKDNNAFGEYDWDLLANEWSDYPLADWGVDLPQDWLETSEPKDAEPQIDKAAELQQKWQVATGEIIEIGRHRLMCGDSTEKRDVGRLCAENRAIATITDPPYSVNYDRSQKERGGSVSAHSPYKEADIDPTTLLGFMEFAPSDVMVFSYPVDRHFFALADAIQRSGFELRKELIWVKDTFSFWMGAKYQQRHEPILVCVKKGRPMGGNVPSNQSTVFEFPRPKAHDMHATAKPLELWLEIIKFHSDAGDVLYDPFAGSGTTLVAAENLNRTCYAMEISPEYCAVILERMTTAFPGIEIKREAQAIAA